MTITPFGWQDGEAGGTPISAQNLEAMHSAAGAYVDVQIAEITRALPTRTAVYSDYQATSSDMVIGVVDTSIPRAVILADPSTLAPGQMVVVKDESGGAGTNPITVIGPIDGLDQVPIATNYGIVWVYSTGTEYAALVTQPVPLPVNPPVIS